MRLILNGKIDSEFIEDVVVQAFDKSVDILMEESPELYKEINDNVQEVYCANVTVDVCFTLKGNDKPMGLTAEHHGRDEVLTFMYDVSNDGEVSLTKYNNDDSGQPSLFSDSSQAIMDIVQGTCKPIESTIDVTGVALVLAGKAGGLDIEIYENRCIKFYQNGNLIGEDTVVEDSFDTVVENYKELFREESEE